MESTLKKCPWDDCGKTSSDPEATFCDDCGKLLVEVSGIHLHGDTYICDNCGLVSSSNKKTKFCKKCGKRSKHCVYFLLFLKALIYVVAQNIF